MKLKNNLIEKWTRMPYTPQGMNRKTLKLFCTERLPLIGSGLENKNPRCRAHGIHMLGRHIRVYSNLMRKLASNI